MSRKDKWDDTTYCTFVWYGLCPEDQANGTRHECTVGPHIDGDHVCACGATIPMR